MYVKIPHSFSSSLSSISVKVNNNVFKFSEMVQLPDEIIFSSSSCCSYASSFPFCSSWSILLIFRFQSSTSSSSSAHSSSMFWIFINISALLYSACSAFLIPYAIELSYRVWYAWIVILISSLTLTRRNPLSAQLIVTYLIISSKA